MNPFTFFEISCNDVVIQFVHIVIARVHKQGYLDLYILLYTIFLWIERMLKLILKMHFVNGSNFVSLGSFAIAFRIDRDMKLSIDPEDQNAIRFINYY